MVALVSETEVAGELEKAKCTLRQISKAANFSASWSVCFDTVLVLKYFYSKC